MIQGLFSWAGAKQGPEEVKPGDFEQIRALFEDAGTKRQLPDLVQKFCLAEQQMEHGQQAVGLHRQYAFVGWMTKQIGRYFVLTPKRANQRGNDFVVFDRRGEMKTKTGDGGVPFSNTGNPERAAEELDNPKAVMDSDLYLLRVYWNERRDSLFIIPREVLHGLFDKYPDVTMVAQVQKKGNPRTVKFKDGYIEEACSHPQTIRVELDWPERPEARPYDKYMDD